MNDYILSTLVRGEYRQPFAVILHLIRLSWRSPPCTKTHCLPPCRILRNSKLLADFRSGITGSPFAAMAWKEEPLRVPAIVVRRARRKPIEIISPNVDSGVAD